MGWLWYTYSCATEVDWPVTLSCHKPTPRRAVRESTVAANTHKYKICPSFHPLTCTHANKQLARYHYHQTETWQREIYAYRQPNELTCYPVQLNTFVYMRPRTTFLLPSMIFESKIQQNKSKYTIIHIFLYLSFTEFK